MNFLNFQAVLKNLTLLIFIASFFFVANISLAENCKIEDWKFNEHLPGTIKIHGATTCESGKLSIRVYDKNDKYFGNGFTYIEGHIFEIFIQDVGKVPDSIKIKYDIKPR